MSDKGNGLHRTSASGKQSRGNWVKGRISKWIGAAGPKPSKPALLSYFYSINHRQLLRLERVKVTISARKRSRPNLRDQYSLRDRLLPVERWKVEARGMAWRRWRARGLSAAVSVAPSEKVGHYSGPLFKQNKPTLT